MDNRLMLNNAAYLPGRSLSFTKNTDATRLRVLYLDNTATGGGNWQACRYELRIDNAPCSATVNIAGDVYRDARDNAHEFRTFLGYCDNVKAGAHTLSVYVRATPAAAQYANSQCMTGWGGVQNTATMTLEVEEMDPTEVRIHVRSSHVTL